MCQRRFGTKHTKNELQLSPQNSTVEPGMTDMLALQTVKTFCTMHPNNPEFHRLIDRTREAMKWFRMGLCKDGENEAIIQSCFGEIALWNQFFNLLNLPHIFANEGVSIPDGILEMQWEASCCLAAMASSKNAKELLSFPDCLSVLGRTIAGSPISLVREKSMLCLGNIFGMDKDCPMHRRKLLRDHMLVNAMIKTIQHPEDNDILKIALWTAGNMMKGDPAPGLENIRPLLETCLKTFETFGAKPQSNERDEVLVDAFCAFRKAMLHDPCVAEDIGKGLIPLALEVSMQAFDIGKHELNARIWRCFVVLSRGSWEIGDFMLKQNVFGIASRFIENKKFLLNDTGGIILVNVCETVINLFARVPSASDTFDHVDGLLFNVVVLGAASKWYVRSKALNLVCSYLMSTSDLAKVSGYLEKDPCLRLLFDFLHSTASHDVVLTIRVLDVIKHVLEVDEASGLGLNIGHSIVENHDIRVIENMECNNDNDQIQARAHEILRYYGADEQSQDDSQAENANPNKIKSSDPPAQFWGNPLTLVRRTSI